jgi:hypothetical protein
MKEQKSVAQKAMERGPKPKFPKVRHLTPSELHQKEMEEYE